MLYPDSWIRSLH